MMDVLVCCYTFHWKETHVVPQEYQRMDYLYERLQPGEQQYR